MTKSTPVLFAFPDKAKVGRVVPKNKIYEHGQVSSSLRERFVEQVEQITWAYKLAPDTLNLQANAEIPEIQVFDLQLKAQEVNEELLGAIDRAIPLPIIFLLHREQQVRMVAAFKRPNQADVSKWVLGDYCYGPWLPAEIIRQPLPIALDLQGLYEQLLRGLLPEPPREGENLAEQLERIATLRRQQQEYRKLEARLHKEKQFNRKVELNAQLREIKTQIDTLSV